MTQEEPATDSPKFPRIVAFLGLAVGLIGIGLAVFVHLRSIQEREPIYYVDPARARIVDIAAASSNLEVHHKGKPIGSKNVTSVLLYVWNQGRLPIMKSDVLEPLVFRFEPGTIQILEARVLKRSRNITKFGLEPSGESLTSSLGIHFNVLEQSDGAAIQIIYAGEAGVPISLKGTIIGVKEIRELTEMQPEQYRMFGFMHIGAGILFASLFFLLWRSSRLMGSRGIVLLRVMIPLVYFLMAAYFFYKSEVPSAPAVPTSIWVGK